MGVRERAHFVMLIRWRKKIIKKTCLNENNSINEIFMRKKMRRIRNTVDDSFKIKTREKNLWKTWKTFFLAKHKREKKVDEHEEEN